MRYFLIITILINLNSYAQNTFETILEIQSNYNCTFIADITENTNGDFYFCGKSYYSSNASLVKTDMFGNKIWDKEIFNPVLGNGEQPSLNTILLNNNKLYLVGQYLNAPNGNSDIVLTSTDLNGNILYSKEYNSGGGYRDFGTFLTITNNDKLILGGQGWDGSAEYGVFIRTDINGNIINDNLGNPSPYIQSPIMDIINTNDNNYITVSSRIVKTDSFYNKLWSIYIPSTQFTHITTFDGHVFYAVGYQYDLNTYHTNRILVKFDNFGNILFTKEYDDSDCTYSNSAKRYEPEYFTSIDKTQDGNLIISGVVSTNCNNINNYKHIGFIQKADTLGNILWTKWFNDIALNTPGIINKVKATNDGGFIAVGRTDHGSYRGYICKSDEYGNGCSTTDDLITITKVKDLKSEIILIENPIKNKQIYVNSIKQFSNFEIISLNGELIERGELDNNRFQLNDNIKGIAFIRLFDKGLLVKTTKIIID